jgi:hypothetical protein
LTSLPDVNVLLALAWGNHPHHEAAHQWFAAESSSGWGTCLLTQSGFVRLSVNPQVVKTSIGCREAIALLEAIIAHPRHNYYGSAPPLTETPFAELARKIVGHRQVADATLLHIAKAHGLKLVTFDRPAASIALSDEDVEVLFS